MKDNKYIDTIALICSIRDGDERAFETFFNIEYSSLKFFVQQYVHDSNVAEDVVQDSFFTLWKSRSQVDPSKNIRAFLYTIAKNRALNILREKIRYSKTPVDEMEGRFLVSVLSSDIMTSQIDSLEMSAIIKKVYLILPEKVRDIFILSREENLTYKEIALKKGVSVKTVERSISIALGMFRKNLSRYMSFLIFFC